MKKHLFTLALIALGATASAQTGIGTRTPDPSAQLDVTATNKGLLAPRVSLTGTGATGNAIASPAAGLLVYNTATAGTAPNNVTPGYYFFNGTVWVKIGTSDGNIYSTDGTLAATRTVTMNNKTLNFSGASTLFSGGNVVIDNGGANGPGFTNGLRFETPTAGEGIASNRTNTTAGNNYRGIDFYTGGVGIHRMSITNTGNVGIGTIAPNASALLDLTSSNQGFLPPRIALTATNSASPTTSPAAGLLVYNTATAGTAPNNVTPGYYYWNGSAWVSFGSGNPVNIYNSNGVLTGTRTVTMANHPLVFTGGSTIFTGGNGITVDYGDATGVGFTNGINFGSTTGTGIGSNRSVTGTGNNYKGLDFYTGNSISRLSITAGGNVGIGTIAPDASALLDLTSTNQGFLPPRIALTATNAAGPITTPANGLLVYNTATAGTSPNNVAPGYYYWNGSAWVSFGSGNPVNIYNSNGVLTGTRTVDLNNYSLFFKNGSAAFQGGALFVDFADNGGTDANYGLRFGNQSTEGMASNRTVTGAANNYKGLNFFTNGLNRMVVTNGGSVGIGTLNPGARLEVSGDAAATGAGIFGASILFNNTNSTGRKYVMGSRSGILAGDGSLVVSDENAGKIRFSIDATGNVGVGDVAASQKVDIDGGLRIRNLAVTPTATRMLVTDNTGVVSAQAMPAAGNTLYTGDGAIAGTALRTVTLNSNGIYFKSGSSYFGGGDVVVDTEGANGTGFTNALRFGNGSGQGISSNQSVNGNNPQGLDLFTGSTSRIAIGNNGYVGIGTRAPSQKLDVDGSVRIRSISQSTDANPTLPISMVTVDADGLIRKQAMPVGAAPIIFATLPANGVTLSSANWANYVYSGASITLPANSKYVINAVVLLQPDAPGTTGQSIWVRSRFSDSPTTFTATPTQGSSLVSGLLPSASQFALLQGSVVISNTTASAKTYYYWVGGVTNHGFNGTIPDVASSGKAENQIYAVPAN